MTLPPAAHHSWRKGMQPPRAGRNVGRLNTRGRSRHPPGISLPATWRRSGGEDPAGWAASGAYRRPLQGRPASERDVRLRRRTAELAPVRSPCATRSRRGTHVTNQVPVGRRETVGEVALPIGGGKVVAQRRPMGEVGSRSQAPVVQCASTGQRPPTDERKRQNRPSQPARPVPRHGARVAGARPRRLGHSPGGEAGRTTVTGGVGGARLGKLEVGRHSPQRTL